MSISFQNFHYPVSTTLIDYITILLIFLSFNFNVSYIDINIQYRFLINLIVVEHTLKVLASFLSKNASKDVFSLRGEEANVLSTFFFVPIFKDIRFSIFFIVLLWFSSNHHMRLHFDFGSPPPSFLQFLYVWNKSQRLFKLCV